MKFFILKFILDDDIDIIIQLYDNEQNYNILILLLLINLNKFTTHVSQGLSMSLLLKKYNPILLKR